ncbi:protein cereblon [Harmonia axyridis]|uniref:protein cereblon n=1 Tax=Harmonia axyridis TaxID=115357 RepID=UPI001E2791A1|nr:protein cereblon [Harmonia axyridis]
MSDSDSDDNNEIENGHIPHSHFNLNQSSSEDDDAEEVTGDFNIELPTSHMYLGKLKDLGGHTLFDDGETLNLLGIDTNTLVLPGFTLPLTFDNPNEGIVMQDYLKKSKVFVLLCAHYSNPSEFFKYGVTMEAVETSIRDGILSLKARGRQRCQILSDIRREEDEEDREERIHTVTVKILPEHKIISPFVDSQLYTLKLKKPLLCEGTDDMKKARKYRRYHSAQYTFPHWLYEEYEVCFIVQKMLAGLKKYFNMEFVPKDPVILSYWFIQNYLLQYEERLRLLQENTVLSRLRLEVQYLKKSRLMLCNHCTMTIADQQDIIVLSKDGIQNNFVNPGGHVYETVTVSYAKNYILTGKPSKKFSWFPGYAWTILQCWQCRNHLGWKFTSNILTPRNFYGLALSGVNVGCDIWKNAHENSLIGRYLNTNGQYVDENGEFIDYLNDELFN